MMMMMGSQFSPARAGSGARSPALVRALAFVLALAATPVPLFAASVPGPGAAPVRDAAPGGGGPGPADEATLLQILDDYFLDVPGASARYGDDWHGIKDSVVVEVVRGPGDHYTVVLDVPEEREGDKPFGSNRFHCRILPDSRDPRVLALLQGYRAGDRRRFLGRHLETDFIAITFECVDAETGEPSASGGVPQAERGR
ncbi:MAG: hypothetical protein LBG06_07315 [Deltaproteobacteria bacterium]|jgi:hypothetical protein|nr:hypothetical protein [Deltaproteobacteria bacterium]